MTALHVFRALTLVACFFVIMGFPGSLARRVHTRRVWLVIGAVELSFVGAAIAVVDSWNRHLVWYRAPRIFASALLLIVYIAIEYREHRPS
jgi:hypothetical protein